MRWQTKARLQRGLERLPGGRTIYYLGQRTFGGLRTFRVDRRVGFASELARELEAAGSGFAGARALEIGTGQAPVIPMALWLHGLESCETFDLDRLMRPGLVRESARQLAARGEGASDRLGSLRGLLATRPGADAILDACKIRYHAPADAGETGLPEASIDVVFSNTVFEHVAPGALRAIFAEARRVLRPGGHMVHIIDPSDHFSHSDRSITPVNFLRFSEEEFARFNTAFLYQNRIRARRWRQIFEENGFEIRSWKTKVHPDALRLLRAGPPSFRVSEEFDSYTPEELAECGIRVVARRT